jgi:hypothetical protein
MKFIKLVQKRGGEIRKSNRGGELDQSSFTHVWKYDNETLLYSYYTLAKK